MIKSFFEYRCLISEKAKVEPEANESEDEENEFKRKILKNSDDHANKYVIPHAVSSRHDFAKKGIPSTPLTLAGDQTTLNYLDSLQLDLKPGQSLIPIQGTTEDTPDSRSKTGKTNKTTEFFVVSTDKKGKQSVSKRVRLPHIRVSTENENSGKHNYEYALSKMWNVWQNPSLWSKEHAKRLKQFRGRVPTINEMHAEIERAKTDETHPLHISKAKASEFAHGINGIDVRGSKEAEKRANETYYQNLKDMSYSIFAMAINPKYEKSWENGDTIGNVGSKQLELSQSFKDEGVKPGAGVSKADALTINSRDTGEVLHRITLKKDSGSQLMSSSPEEFSAIFKTALKNYYYPDEEHEDSNNPENTTQNQRRVLHDDAVKKVDAIKGLMRRQKHVAANQKLKELQEFLRNRLHPDQETGNYGITDYPRGSFLRNVAHEALSAKGKFPTEDGRATHIVTTGPGARVYSIEDYLDHSESVLPNVEITQGKHKGGANPSSARLRAPDITSNNIQFDLSYDNAEKWLRTHADRDRKFVLDPDYHKYPLKVRPEDIQRYHDSQNAEAYYRKYGKSHPEILNSNIMPYQTEREIKPNNIKIDLTKKKKRTLTPRRKKMEASRFEKITVPRYLQSRGITLPEPQPQPNTTASGKPVADHSFYGALGSTQAAAVARSPNTIGKKELDSAVTAKTGTLRARVASIMGRR